MLWRVTGFAVGGEVYYAGLGRTTRQVVQPHMVQSQTLFDGQQGACHALIGMQCLRVLGGAMIPDQLRQACEPWHQVLQSASQCTNRSEQNVIQHQNRAYC